MTEQSVATQDRAEDRVEQVVAMVANACQSPETRRVYIAHTRAFLAWLAPGQLNRQTVSRYRAELLAAGKGAVTINGALAAIKMLAREAAASGWMDSSMAEAVAGVESVPRRGVRLGNWLTAEDVRKVLAVPDRATMMGKRDLAMLGLFLGAGLRRAEVARLVAGHLKERDGRLCVVDMVGKGGRVRTVPLAAWAAEYMTAWLQSAGISEGPVMRQVRRGDRLTTAPVSGAGCWYIITEMARAAGVAMAPHDLRRTAAKKLRGAGVAIEQVSKFLGHASVQTTELYLGAGQDLGVWDGVEWS